MRGSKISVCVFGLLALSGCGIADHYMAQDRMTKSQDAYRSCVVANPQQPDKCAALKTIYEEDKAAFEK